jgi:hypothetical protein
MSEIEKITVVYLDDRRRLCTRVVSTTRDGRQQLLELLEEIAE